jgi:hypothetical protein
MSGATGVKRSRVWGAHAARVLVGKPGRSFTRVTAAARRNELFCKLMMHWGDDDILSP